MNQISPPEIFTRAEEQGVQGDTIDNTTVYRTLCAIPINMYVHVQTCARVQCLLLYLHLWTLDLVVLIWCSSTIFSTQLIAELFGPGHFVGHGLGLRLKSEIRTRT
jgi:hypothetical protein